MYFLVVLLSSNNILLFKKNFQSFQNHSQKSAKFINQTLQKPWYIFKSFDILSVM